MVSKLLGWYRWVLDQVYRREDPLLSVRVRTYKRTESDLESKRESTHRESPEGSRRWNLE